jgi:hypothetical protein
MKIRTNLRAGLVADRCGGSTRTVDRCGGSTRCGGTTRCSGSTLYAY